MLPLDVEFCTFYACYGLFLVLALLNLIVQPRKRTAKVMHILFGLLIYVYLFADPKHFEGGNALAVLFFASVTLTAQFIILAVLWKRKQV